jgi:hypothetical protein
VVLQRLNQRRASRLVAIAVALWASGTVAQKAKPAPRKPDPAAPAAAEAAPAAEEVIRESRIEFDERLIAGQTAKPGSVRIFERRDSDLASLVSLHRQLRGAIVRSILGRDVRDAGRASGGTPEPVTPAKLEPPRPAGSPRPGRK